MPKALKCFGCHTTYDVEMDQDTCPECGTNNVSTWVYDEA